MYNLIETHCWGVLGMQSFFFVCMQALAVEKMIICFVYLFIIVCISSSLDFL